MASRGWEEGGVAWVWRMHLLAWEEETVTVCSVLLHNIVLQDDIPNRWWWLLDPVNGYFVKGTYHFLTTADASPERGMLSDVWHKQTLLKVSLFAWRLLRNRLLTRDNLV